MKNIYIFSATLLALSVSFFSTGCNGSSDSVPRYGAKSASANYFKIQTITTKIVNTSIEAWGNTTISGYADPNTVPCDPTNDSDCIAQVGGPYQAAIPQNQINSFKTNGSGLAYFATDAQAAKWFFEANGPSGTYCPATNATATTLRYSSTGTLVSLECGANTATMLATPSSCIIDQSVSPAVYTCGGNITLSIASEDSSSYSLPQNESLVAASFNDSGTNVTQTEVTATDASSVTVAMPTTAGIHYVTIIDPATNLVVGVAEFDVVYTPASTCTAVNCGGTISQEPGTN